MEFGGCYLRSRPLKGTTWIPRGPPSLDTSTNFTISLEDRGGKEKPSEKVNKHAALCKDQ